MSGPEFTEGIYRFRVRYVECDPMGFLHHSHYLPYFELGRTELLRKFGVSYRELEARDVLFVVTKVTVNFKRPARYDELVPVRESVEEMGEMAGGINPISSTLSESSTPHPRSAQ